MGECTVSALTPGSWNLGKESADEFQAHLLGKTTLAGAELSVGCLAAAWQSQGGWQGWLGAEESGISLLVSHS